MIGTQIHKQKIISAINNPKFVKDLDVLKEVLNCYEEYIKQISELKSKKNEKILDMTKYLNEYKDYLEIELIAKKGSSLLNRQNGQLKLYSSVIGNSYFSRS